MLNRHLYNLEDYLKKKAGHIEKVAFMNALRSAIDRLHSPNWAHNDLNLTNVMINENALSILADFGSAREIGKPLGTFRVTTSWIEGQIEDYKTLKKEHDLFALEKMRVWLDNPTFMDEKKRPWEGISTL